MPTPEPTPNQVEGAMPSPTPNQVEGAMPDPNHALTMPLAIP